MDNKMIIFEEFARKAAKRIEEKKKHRIEHLRIKSMEDLELEIRGLSDTEFNDCMEFSDNAIEVDQYTLYMASSTLQNAAKLMVDNGSLLQGNEYKITEMFSALERNFIVKRIMALSGVTGEADIEVINETAEIKNS